MATRMQQRRGTAAQWTAANPVLAAGEIGFETDTSKFKIGNGSSAWSALQYYTSAEELAAVVGNAPELLNTLGELSAALNDDPLFYATMGETVTDHINDSTMVHGIADTSALATLTDVNNAADAAASALSDHTSATTTVHGIADTSLLATQSDVNDAADAAASALSDHTSATTTVHGIADTSLLATQSDVNDAADAAASALGVHEALTENVHGIVNTEDLVTQSDLTNAITGATVDQSTLAGTGIDWNTLTEQFDIDSTVATKTYADDAVSTHNSDQTNVHGIADTAALATKTYADGKASDAQDAAETYADNAVSTAVAALTKSSVGLGNVDNTSDANKPVSTAQASAIATAKSEAIADATAQVNAVIASAPAALNTLDELAAALGDDANFATTVTNSLALKAPLASPTFTGTVTVAADGIAFTDGTQTKEGVPSRTPIIQKTAAYTLSALTERDSLIEVDSTSAVTLSIPTDASVNYPVGTTIDILQTNTGQVTIAAATPATTTVNATPGLKLRTRWSSATLLKRAANTWVVYGDLTA